MYKLFIFNIILLFPSYNKQKHLYSTKNNKRRGLARLNLTSKSGWAGDARRKTRDKPKTLCKILSR